MDPAPSSPSLRTTLERLLRLAQSGDAQAFRSLFDLCQERVLRVIRIRLGANPPRGLDTDEVAQQTILKAWQHLHEFEARDAHKFVGWLAGIANNVIRDGVRRDRGRPSEIPFDLLIPRGSSTISIPLPDRASSPSQRASGAELLEAIDSCLSEMPERHREAIVLRMLSEMSWEECAEALGCPTAKAAWQLHARAMAELRQSLERAGYSPP